MKPEHRQGTYHVDSRKVRDAANTHPGTVCIRCGRTLGQHDPHKNGKPARWTAGHTVPKSTTYALWLTVTQRPPAGDWLGPEASTCNGEAQATPVAARIITTRSW